MYYIYSIYRTYRNTRYENYRNLIIGKYSIEYTTLVRLTHPFKRLFSKGDDKGGRILGAKDISI